MSDIASGYVIWVDTASLRGAAGQVDLAVAELEQAYAALRAAEWATPVAMGPSDSAGLATVAVALRDRVAGLASALRYTADVYEAADALWHIERFGHAGPTGRASGDALGDLHAQYVGTGRDPVAEAQALLDEREENWDDELLANATLGLPYLTDWLPGANSPRELGQQMFDTVTALGFGVIPPGSTLRPDPTPGDYSTKSEALRQAESGPPQKVADFVDRIPDDPRTNVRVEVHTFPDGHREYAVYVRGTEDMMQDGDWNLLPGEEDGIEALDGNSNFDLYGRAEGESYRAVEQALRNAGAQPGDIVHGAGHSQGAMIIEWLAMQGTYDFRTVVSVAPPVQAMLGEETRHITLRYDDDPVAGLAGAGVSGAAGGPGSVVVRDVHHPGFGGLGDVDQLMEPHALEGYRELARDADASGDPRITDFHDEMARLNEATKRQVSDSYISRTGEPG
jgi:hypothetical protein